MSNTVEVSYNKLRISIGILGIALPTLLYLHTVLFGECSHLQDSISHYYYTIGGFWFNVVLWVLGLILIFYPAYKNETKIDTILTTIAGVCAICVSLFPTNPNGDNCAVYALSHSKLREQVFIMSVRLPCCLFFRTSVLNYLQKAMLTKTN